MWIINIYINNQLGFFFFFSIFPLLSTVILLNLQLFFGFNEIRLNGCTFFPLHILLAFVMNGASQEGRASDSFVETRCFFAGATSFGLSAQVDSCNEENFIYYV